MAGPPAIRGFCSGGDEAPRTHAQDCRALRLRPAFTTARAQSCSSLRRASLPEEREASVPRRRGPGQTRPMLRSGAMPPTQRQSRSRCRVSKEDRLLFAVRTACCQLTANCAGSLPRPPQAMETKTAGRTRRPGSASEAAPGCTTTRRHNVAMRDVILTSGSSPVWVPGRLSLAAPVDSQAASAEVVGIAVQPVGPTSSLGLSAFLSHMPWRPRPSPNPLHAHAISDFCTTSTWCLCPNRPTSQPT